MRHLLDWHRRENKSLWWRFYELMGMSEDELVDGAEPIGQLEFVGVVVARTKRNRQTTSGTTIPRAGTQGRGRERGVRPGDHGG